MMPGMRRIRVSKHRAEQIIPTVVIGRDMATNI